MPKYTKVDDDTVKTTPDEIEQSKESLLNRKAYIMELRDARKKRHDDVYAPELAEIEAKLKFLGRNHVGNGI